MKNFADKKALRTKCLARNSTPKTRETNARRESVRVKLRTRDVNNVPLSVWVCFFKIWIQHSAQETRDVNIWISKLTTRDVNKLDSQFSQKHVNNDFSPFEQERATWKSYLGRFQRPHPMLSARDRLRSTDSRAELLGNPEQSPKDPKEVTFTPAVTRWTKILSEYVHDA